MTTRSSWETHRELRANEVRAGADFSPDPIKAKIAEAEKAKVHTMLVIASRWLRLRHRDLHQGKKRGWILTHLMAALLMGPAILAAGIFRAMNR